MLNRPIGDPEMLQEPMTERCHYTTPNY